MADLDIRTVEKQNTHVISPKGFINAHTVSDFEDSIQKVIQSGQFKIIINCSGLEYINSSGLGVLMGVIEDIQENDGFLWLSNMNKTVFNIFDTLGFTHLFKVFDNEEEAFQNLAVDAKSDQ